MVSCGPHPSGLNCAQRDASDVQKKGHDQYIRSSWRREGKWQTVASLLAVCAAVKPRYLHAGSDRDRFSGWRQRLLLVRHGWFPVVAMLKRGEGIFAGVPCERLACRLACRLAV